MLCRSLVTLVLLFLASPPFVGLVPQSLLPSLHWKLLSMAIQPLCCIFSSNLIQSCPLRQLANVSSVFHWPKSCAVMHKFRQKFVPHSIQTFHYHFVPSCIDVISTFQNLEWVAVILDSCVWCVQNHQHFHEGLAEVMGLKGCYYPLVPWLQKWYCIWWYVNNIDIQSCCDPTSLQHSQGHCQREEEPWLVTYPLDTNGAQ